MNDNAQITDLLLPYLNDGQFYIVDLQVVGRQGGRIKVTILLDSDTGITIDECAEISRRLGSQLDELNFFGDAPFILEVSSPGVDYPLSFPRQYIRNLGRELTVMLLDGSLLRGKLTFADEAGIVLDIEPEKKSKSKKKKEAELSIKAPAVGPTPIPFEQIKKANVEVSFN